AARTDYYQNRKKKIVSNYESLRQQYALALPNMKDYNASQTQLDLLDQTLAEVKAALSKPVAIRSSRKLTNQEIEDAVQKMNLLYRDVLQPNMDGFVISKPELYKTWVQASKVINTAASRSSNGVAASAVQLKIDNNPVTDRENAPNVATEKNVASSDGKEDVNSPTGNGTAEQGA
ncbi:MAG: hypothetical protein AAB316_00555, partial [Bacteroidota bacterium]